MRIPIKFYHNISYEAIESAKIIPEVSLVVAFYNDANFFKLVFASIEVQTLDNFELIVCDDGSESEAVEAIRHIYDNSKIPVLHIWHSDRGFKKNECLNRSIEALHSDYIVFIDADCVLHPEFLRDHLINRMKGHTLSGRRVNLTAGISRKLSTQKIKQGWLQKNWWWIILAIILMKDNNGVKGIRITILWLYKYLNKKPRGLVGSNFSIYRLDLLRVNGFDMSYEKPGIGEDSDIDWRLSKMGITPIPMCFQGIQYHLYHRLLPRSSENEVKFAAMKKTRNYITTNGIEQLDK